MIIPSIDLMDGQTVQLIGGAMHELQAGDPMPIARKFSRAGEIAVVDLDAALGKGSNRGLIEGLVRQFSCRVGGGIRDVDAARAWLDAGATKVVLGTAARPEVLRQLPPERAIAALDARNGEVVVEGWQKRTGVGILERMQHLRGLVSGFLVTFVEREGRMMGTALDQVGRIVQCAAPARVTIAGGVTTPEEIAELDRLGADAQVGMALYKGTMDLGDAISAPLGTDRADGLFATVVTDERGVALGLAWSNRESIREAVRTGTGVYHSRSRGGLWVKGQTSGSTQELIRIDLDCDRDALKFVVSQAGAGFCHNGTRTCWGDDSGLSALERTLQRRKQDAPEGSYTRRLMDDPGLLRSKLLEEAKELSEASSQDDVAWEIADVMFFAMVAAARAGVSLADVERELDRRALKISRRKGDPKPGREGDS